MEELTAKINEISTKIDVVVAIFKKPFNNWTEEEINVYGIEEQEARKQLRKKEDRLREEMKQLRDKEQEHWAEELAASFRSESSSSIQDIEDSYEEHGTKTVQKYLQNVYSVINYEIQGHKELSDKDVFALIGQWCVAKYQRQDGEIDVYLGVTSPAEWSVSNIPPVILSVFHVVNGTFQQSCQSLQSQKENELTLNSSLTAELSLHFNYYCIFEITTQPKLSYKLHQLEYQLQYIVARHFHRQKRQFPPPEISALIKVSKKRLSWHTRPLLDMKFCSWFALLDWLHPFITTQRRILLSQRLKKSMVEKCLVFMRF